MHCRSMIRVAASVALAAALSLTLACSGKSTAAEGAAKGGGAGGGKGKAGMQFPVEVMQVAAQNVEYAVTGVGSVEAFETVAVTSRVAGAVERVAFIEGQRVAAGSTLVEIEPQRFRLAVDAARANYEKAAASLAEAQAGLARREAANNQNPGLIPAEQVETFRTRVETARSEVAQARAALNQAELNLRDAYVKAPVSGIIQTRTVQTGQYVPVGTVLATLVRRDPLLLRFRIPEQQARTIRTGLPVKFTVAEAIEAYNGRITHVAASADPTTRMVEITAQITDPRRESLTPGSFARVSVPIGSPVAAPVIPQTAIRPTERGFVAFVVEGDTARERIVNLGMRTDQGMVEVKSGINAGEQLVIRGAEALRDGAKVRVSS